MSDDEMERAFSIQSPARLSVHGHAGDVHIEAWDDSVIRVRAEGGEPSFSATESTVEVRPGSGPASIDYEIRVPRACSVDVNGSSGDITVEGTTGDVTIRTQTGDVTLSSIRGNSTVRTASGELSAEEVSGSLTFNTASGDLTVERSSLTSFDLESASGEAEIETSLARTGRYHCRTVSGDLNLHIPRGTGASVVFRTQSGDLECELPAQITQASRHRWEGAINGGGAVIELESVSGDVEIEESEDLPAAQRFAEGEVFEAESHGVLPDSEMESAADGSPSSGEILEQLARGEIGVDEAMAELERIGS